MSNKKTLDKTLADFETLINEIRQLQIALVKRANSPEAVRTITRKLGALL